MSGGDVGRCGFNNVEPGVLAGSSGAVLYMTSVCSMFIDLKANSMGKGTGINLNLRLPICQKCLEQFQAIVNDTSLEQHIGTHLSSKCRIIMTRFGIRFRSRHQNTCNQNQ